MTYEKELEILLLQIGRNVLENKRKEFLSTELEDEFFNFQRDIAKGEFIDGKKHGLKLIAMVLNEIILKC